MDEELIRQIITKYEETWINHDMDAWGDLFTEDADYVNRSGGWWQSKKESVEAHKWIHENLKGTKMRYRMEIKEISFLKDDIALVHITWTWPEFKGQYGKETSNFGGIITMVMVKQDGSGWLIRSLQNTITESL